MNWGIAIRGRSTKAQVTSQKRHSMFPYQLLLGLAIFGSWEFVSGRWVDDFWISSPTKVAEQMVTLFISGEILPHLSVTLQEAVIGYALGACLGIVIGFTLAHLTMLARVLDPYIMTFNGIPRIALAPLLIIWFGIGMTSKLLIVVLMIFFITFFNTYSGAQSVDPHLIQMIRILGANRRQTLTKIIVPATMPWIMAALRMSVPYAAVGAVVGEFVASSRGLGYLIQLYSAYFDTTGALASIFVLALLVMAGNGLVHRIERRALAWRTDTQAQGGSAL